MHLARTSNSDGAILVHLGWNAYDFQENQKASYENSGLIVLGFVPYSCCATSKYFSLR